MKVYTESIISEMKPVKSNENSSALCIVSGPCMEFGSKPNRNNRIYSRKLVEDRILNNPTIKEALKNKSMLGEGGHPESRVDISYPEVALAVEKLWIPEGDGNMLWGQFAILDTPTGRILNTLVQYGTKLGISARAVADSYQKDGHEIIVESSYELITFDAVPEPGFKCARLEKVDPISKSVDKMSTKELKESAAALRSFKNPVFESRIRSLDKEISKRENKININTIAETVDRLASVVNKSLERYNKVKSEKELRSLIKEAKQIINDANKLKNESVKLNKIVRNESSNINMSDTNLHKFNESNVADHSYQSNISNNIDNKENFFLEKMCSTFRRI